MLEHEAEDDEFLVWRSIVVLASKNLCHARHIMRDHYSVLTVLYEAMFQVWHLNPGQSGLSAPVESIDSLERPILDKIPSEACIRQWHEDEADLRWQFWRESVYRAEVHDKVPRWAWERFVVRSVHVMRQEIAEIQLQHSLEFSR